MNFVIEKFCNKALKKMKLIFAVQQSRK